LTADHPQQHHDDGDHQQDVDEAAHGGESPDPAAEDEQHDGDGVKHGDS
jgi:hypothetical protein